MDTIIDQQCRNESRDVQQCRNESRDVSPFGTSEYGTIDNAGLMNEVVASFINQVEVSGENGGEDEVDRRSECSSCSGRSR